MQYCSLNDHQTPFEVDGSGGFGVTWSQRELAHLAFDPAPTLPVATRYNPLLQDLIQYRFMKHHPLLWGE